MDVEVRIELARGDADAAFERRHILHMRDFIGRHAPVAVAVGPGHPLVRALVVAALIFAVGLLRDVMIADQRHGLGLCCRRILEDRTIVVATAVDEEILPAIGNEGAAREMKHRPRRFTAARLGDRIAAVLVAEIDIGTGKHLRPRVVEKPGRLPRLSGPIEFISADARLIGESIVSREQLVRTRGIDRRRVEVELGREPFAFQLSIKRPARRARKARRRILHPERIGLRSETHRKNLADALRIEASRPGGTALFSELGKEFALRAETGDLPIRTA